MFRTPDGWTSKAGEDTIDLEHSENGWIRLWTRHAPIMRLEELAKRRWRDLDGYTVESEDVARVMSTPTGATACVLTSDGRYQKASARGILVLIVLPDVIVTVGGVALQDRGSHLEAAVREIVSSFEIGDATLRFLYAPPRDWHGRAQGEGTVWYAPAFPRMRASMTVSPAERRPAQGAPVHIYEAIVAADRNQRFVREHGEGPDDIASDFGLAGSAWFILGQPHAMPRLCRDIVVLADDQYVYTFILATLSRTDRDAMLPAMREVVRSSRPARGFAERVLA